MSLSRKFGHIKKLTKGGAIIPIKPELLAKINREFNIDSCFEIFNELPRMREELTLREPKCYAGVFIKDDLPYRVVKYDDLFSSSTFDVYNFNSENYTKPVKCLSYSLYRDEVFGYSITMLLNLLQTCNILREKDSDLLVRLYISHNLFLLKPDEFEKPESDNLIYILTILDELLKFPFFELHQVYIEDFHSRSLIPEIIEKQRLFRFIGFIDPTLDVCYSKDIDSIITNTEFEDFERFYRDERYLLGYYNFYKRFSYDSAKKLRNQKNKFLNVDNYDDEYFEILEKFESRPKWFSLYQNAFPKPMLKYKLPAGLVMVKRGVITVERFREIFNLIKTNYHKIKVFLFNLIGRLTNHKDEPLKRNRYTYDFDNLKINYDFYKIDRTIHPPKFPEPTAEDYEKFEVLQSIHYCGGLYQSYYISPLETLNVGFDENFLTNLLSFIPEGRVLELEVDEKITTPTKTNVPIINDFKTSFELKPDYIEYLPVDTSPSTSGGKKKLPKKKSSKLGN